MLKVKRYGVLSGNLTDGTSGFYTQVIDARHYDAAQSELAALREELTESHRREALLQDMVTAAEQRNAELIGLLTRTLAYYTESCFPEDLLVEVKIAIGALKPTESGDNKKNEA